MDYIVGVTSGDCSTTGVGTEVASTLAMFDPNVWVLLIIPVLFFVLTFVFKGNLILGVLTIVTSSVMLYHIIYSYDNIYAVPLILMIIGTSVKIAHKSLTVGAEI